MKQQKASKSLDTIHNETTEGIKIIGKLMVKGKKTMRSIYYILSLKITELLIVVIST